MFHWLLILFETVFSGMEIRSFKTDWVKLIKIYFEELKVDSISTIILCDIVSYYQSNFLVTHFIYLSNISLLKVIIFVEWSFYFYVDFSGC